MNYRHAFHAGNFADVVKHAVLARILVHLRAKDAGFRVVDSHAGIGLYDLAGEAAERTGEWQGGIGRIAGADLGAATAEFLAPWLDVVRGLNPDGELRHYPGSPVIAARMMRRQDRLVANELHPEDADLLEAALAGCRQAKVMRLDGWTAVKSLLPPPERRGLLVVDPPFEREGEFERLATAMVEASRRFAGGVQLLWYPEKKPAAVRAFHRAVVESGVAPVLRIAHRTRTPTADGPLAAAGLLVVNPPWRLADEAAAVLPVLAAAMADGAGAGAEVDWLVPEPAR